MKKFMRYGKSGWDTILNVKLRIWDCMSLAGKSAEGAGVEDSKLRTILGRCLFSTDYKDGG